MCIRDSAKPPRGRQPPPPPVGCSRSRESATTRALRQGPWSPRALQRSWRGWKGAPPQRE
eukprot:9325032-Alexandrium_andersonii.AAC.1